MTDANAALGLRGPADHDVREQIVVAALEQFSRYGYGKTTVADLAKQIGYSKAYIYRFFESKQAIGEAICSQCLAKILSAMATAVDNAKTPTEALRALAKIMIQDCVELLFEDRKLFEIAAHSASERWRTFQNYEATVSNLVRNIILRGREAGEFERKTPLDETVRVILQVLQPFMQPVMLEYNLARLPDSANEVVNLILRSLAP
jgi:AcrR family transcriptional regulator